MRIAAANLALRVRWLEDRAPKLGLGGFTYEEFRTAGWTDAKILEWREKARAETEEAVRRRAAERGVPREEALRVLGAESRERLLGVAEGGESA